VEPFLALADPTRRRIVEALTAGPLSSGEIAARFPISAPAISQHLKALKTARLVRVRSEAQKRIYEIDPEGIDAVAGWAEGVRRHWAAKLDILEANLKGKD
jgi:DNA-binding transcriptional ArsR family regulator